MAQSSADLVLTLPAEPLAMRRLRIALVDAARAVALVCMAIFHFTWDLGYFGFIELQAGVDPGWRLFAKLIAGSFLVLVGVSLVLAARGGLDWRAYGRRLGMIAAGAAGITLATWWATPDGYVFFGILHCIAVSSVLALPFLRLPLWLVAAAAAACLALPSFAASPAFDAPWLLWLGLAQHLPRTNDYEPLLPWFGVVLAGVFVGRLVLAAGWEGTLARWRGDGPAGRALRTLGRHSLAFYLIHQPVLFGLLWILATLAPGLTHAARMVPSDPQLECRAACEERGEDPGLCARACGCISRRLAGTGLLTRPVERLAPEERERILSEAQSCRREAETAP